MAEKNIEDYLNRFGPPQLRVFLANSDTEFVDAVEASLESAVQHMEAGATFNHNRDERALVHELVGCLAGGGLSAQNEAHSNGHVDVTVVHWQHNGWRVLGECTACENDREEREPAVHGPELYADRLRWPRY